MTRRRILHEIKLDKIAAVDAPCQEHAKAVLMKRAGASGNQPDQGANRMSDILKKALGLPATATDAEVEAAVAKLATGTAEAVELKKRADDAEAEAAIMKSVIALPENHRQHYLALEKADKDKAKAFLALKDGEKEDECKKAAAQDETIVVEGQTISKRSVGDSVFAIFKSQAEKIAKNAADIAKAQEAADNATFAKRAVDEFPHLAGTVEQRALVLKALSKADEPTRTAAEALLKAAEASAKFAFEKAGHNPQTQREGSPEAELQKKADEIKKREPALTAAAAYTKAMEENPALYAATVNKTAAPSA